MLGSRENLADVREQPGQWWETVSSVGVSRGGQEKSALFKAERDIRIRYQRHYNSLVHSALQFVKVFS